MSQERNLTNSLLAASLFKTREEARKIIKKADEASIELSGLPYGFPMELSDETD